MNKKLKKFILTALAFCSTSMAATTFAGCNSISYYNPDCFIVIGNTPHKGDVKKPLLSLFGNGEATLILDCERSVRLTKDQYIKSKVTPPASKYTHVCEDCFH